MIRVAVIEPPARTSNKYETWRSLPDARVTIVSDRDGWDAESTIVLDVGRLPLVGGAEGWTLAPAWLRGLRDHPLGDPDVVVSLELFSFTTAQAGSLARRRAIPHVVHVAETMADNPLYRIPPYRGITRRHGMTADLVVCSTERARRHAIALGCAPERTEVVAPGVDVELFRPADEPPQRPTVLFVGALRADRGADKGVLDIIAACDIVVAEVPDLRLELVGDGHLRPKVEALAATRPYLELVGPLPRRDVAERYRRASAFVLASKRTWKWEEQFGFVLLEAMSSGLPVVATRCGSIPEIVPDWNSLVEPGDVESLAAAIEAALGPSALTWGQRNRQHAVEHFAIPSRAARMRQVLGKVVR